MSITQVTFKTWICEELIFIQTLFLQCFPGIFQKPVNAYAILFIISNVARQSPIAE